MNSSASEARLQIVPSISTIREARKFLARYFAPTRLIPAPFLSQTAGKLVYLKLETELPTSRLKVRGAFWALAQRMSRGPIQEGVACRTGNHGAAGGFGAKRLGVRRETVLRAQCAPVSRRAHGGAGGE